MVPKSGSSFIALGVVGSKNLDAGGVAGEPLGDVSVCTDEPSMVGHESLDSVRPFVFSAAGNMWPRWESEGGLLSLVGLGGQEPCLCVFWIVCGVLFLRWLRRELLLLLFSWEERPLCCEAGGLLGLPVWLGVVCP